jgi:glyoxylase-like metal-dependent hydrolase (beta-lactamase superfamily II)
MDFGPPLTVGVYLWYIEGPEKKILVDAGGTVDTLSPFIPLISPNATLENIQSCEQGLSRVGLKPEDIDLVILTQMHLDHIELARKFTKATFIIQRAELDFANNPHPIMAAYYIKPFFEGLNFEVIEGDREIVEGIRVLFTPGHSAGGQSVVIDTAKGTAIISGFCCIRENFEPPEPLKEMMPIILPGIHLNPVELYDSVLKVKRLANILIPIHDVEFVDKERIP